MDLTQLNPGDLVYAATAIHKGGRIPGLELGALLAGPGSHGVIPSIGRLEEDPHQAIYLVRFEGEGLVLGPPTGCWP